jgi:hypothetical protein
MSAHARRIAIGFFGALALAAPVVQASAAPATAAGPARFEVTSIRAVRPTLVATLEALKKNDIAGAKAAFAGYGSGWVGIEVYINTRSKDLYNALELTLEAKINKELAAPTPDIPMLIADVQAIIAKYDEAIALASTSPPLSPVYDDIAHLRMVRTPLRAINPAIKAGDYAKARSAWKAFDDNWDSIEDLIKAKSPDAYVAIEKDMIQIEQALMPAAPDATQVATLLGDLTMNYNAQVTAIMTEARAHG